MLTSLLAKDVQWISILDALIYAVIGFAVTFVGIFLLIFFVWLLGKGAKQASVLRGRKKEETVKELPAAEMQEPAEEIGEEVRVAIIAAIAAYYAGEQSSCEFKVKRIKRI